MKKFINYKYKVNIRLKDFLKEENDISDELAERFDRGSKDNTYLYNKDYLITNDLFGTDIDEKPIYLIEGQIVGDTKSDCRSKLNNLKSVLKDTFQVKRIEMLMEASGDLIDW